ncbi:MAG: PKD domain-containing protein, partial [Saprospiraceae bacterium]|nr:PKD domain-containing protein [Saprospiraceae bacterium]
MKNRFVFLLALAIAFLVSSSSLFSQNIQMAITGPAVVCGGNCYTYTAVLSSPSGPITHFVNYEWTVTINGNSTTFSSTEPKIDLCFPVSSGTITISLVATSDDGLQKAAALYPVFVLPYQPVEIISSNVSACSPDSLTQGQDQQCEKVCPNSIVTYSLKDPPVVGAGGTNSSTTWSVIGAQSYTVNQPNAASVTVNWGATGAGSVSVVIIGNPNTPTGGNGCSGEASLCITIVEEPEAKFLPDPAPAAPTDTLQVCKDQTVWFQNQSLYADTYEWYFSDDASVSTSTDPQHTFLTPGLYAVRLIARSACLCSDTTEAWIEVLDAEAPTLDCIGDICPGATVTYKATSNCSGITWAVSANGTPLSGGSPGADSITIQWNTGPVGLITLSNFTCTGQVCPQPTQIRIPVIDDLAEIRGPEKVCPGAEEIYSIYPYGGTGFVWTLNGGGQITDGQGTNSVTIKWNDFANPNTTYWLSVQYDNCYLGCGGRDSIPVRIVSPFVINGPVETCENTSKNFTSRLTSNNQSIVCNWTVRAPDGSIGWTSAAPTAAPSILFDKGPGTYRIQAVPDNPLLSCSERADWSLNVPALPDAPTGIAGPTLICPGQTFTYSASGLPASADIRWTVQNGSGAATTLFGNPVNVTWGATGPYQLEAAQVSADGLGCLSPPVQLNLQVLGALVIAGPASRCANSTATYTAPLMPGIPYQWTLQPADAGTISQGQGTNTIEVFWQTPGNHQVSLSACNLSATRAVVVNPLAAPVVNPPGPLCPGATAIVQTSTPYATYTWADAGTGGPLGSAATVDLGPGNYAVTVTDANGCTGSTQFGIEDAPIPTLTVSTPNPTGFCNNSETVVMQVLTNTDGNLSYEWFRDGVALGVNATSYSTNQYGQYTVQATTPAGCTAQAGPITIFEDCGGGGGGAPCPIAPDCPPGSVNLQIIPSLRCDSFNFQLSGANYVAGSGQWYFGQSGGALAGTATGDTPSFVFPNPGYYLTGIIVELSSGLVCRVIDSLAVEAVARFTAQPACPGTASGFKDISLFLPNSGITNWNWDFGDPASGANNSSIVRNASHLYATGGTYPVSLTVTANSGCTASTTVATDIPMPVTPVFAAPPANCAGNALAFSSSPLSVEWNFGDPASGTVNQATGQTVYHIFPAGNYTVTATATDAFGCKTTGSQNITIVPNALSGTITPANPSPLCQGRFLTLTAPAGGISYLWSDNSQANTLVVQTEGVYSVTLTNANGCTYAPPAVQVDVLPDPNAVVKALLTNELGQTIGVAYPTHTVCYGEDVRLFAQGSGGYTYQWSNGSIGTSIDFSAGHNGVLPVGAHLYTVTVTELSTGCTAVTAPFLVTVNPVPTGFSIANSSAPACAAANNTLNYTGPNPGNWQYVWNTGQSGVPLQTENPGVFYLRVVNEFGCEARSNPLTILPGPNVGALPAGCHTRCKPDTLCLPLLPNIASWQWYLNGSPLPGATGPNFIAQQSGTYWAQLTDFNGCTNKSGDLSLQLLDGYGNILGQVWSDVNNNGLIDSADTLVSGIAVRLLQGATPAGTAQSGLAGAFAFTNILSTNYSVEIDPVLLPAGWQIVVGNDPAMLSGCNAETQVGLLLKAVCLSTITSNVQLSACPGGSALYNGTPIAVGSSQAFPFVSVAGCDSVVTVTVTPYATSTGTLNASACPGSSFDYNGTPVPAGTTQDFVLQNYLGCDSILTVAVSALPLSTGTLNASACPGSSFDYNGTPVLAGTSHTFFLQNYLGCDSILTVAVSALPVSTGTLNGSACPGSSFDYNGTPVPAGTSQTFVLQN